MKAILLVDHGSVRNEANEMLVDMAQLVQRIAEGFANCVEAGANEVIVFPYMLSPGRHSTTDIPRMVNAAAANHPGVTFSVTPPFGIEEKLGEIILARAHLSAESPA
jgi:sirohydrochlorin ferrochelatase